MIEEGWLELKSDKSNAHKIIQEYKDDPRLLNKGKLLLIISNQRINAYRTELASLMGIEKKLTFHAARHTFSTTVRSPMVFRIATVSAMLRQEFAHDADLLKGGSGEGKSGYEDVEGEVA